MKTLLVPTEAFNVLTASGDSIAAIAEGYGEKPEVADALNLAASALPVLGR